MDNKPKLWFWGKSGFKSKRNACSRGFQFFWRVEGEGGVWGAGGWGESVNSHVAKSARLVV